MTKKTNIFREYADLYQVLFNLMFEEHDLILTISEMDEIIITCEKVKQMFSEWAESNKNQRNE